MGQACEGLTIRKSVRVYQHCVSLGGDGGDSIGGGESQVKFCQECSAVFGAWKDVAESYSRGFEHAVAVLSGCGGVRCRSGEVYGLLLEQGHYMVFSESILSAREAFRTKLEVEATKQIAKLRLKKASGIKRVRVSGDSAEDQ